MNEGGRPVEGLIFLGVIAVWLILLFFTMLTVVTGHMNLGAANIFIALAIAITKATLVVLFFMHLFYDKLFHSVIIVVGVLAASLFVGFALMDSSQYQETILWTYSAP